MAFAAASIEELEDDWPESIDLPCVDSMHFTLCTRTVCTWTIVCTYLYALQLHGIQVC